MAAYSKLRGLLAERDINTEHLAKLIGLRTAASISQRMSGKTPWRMDEMYTILDLCGIPHDQLHIYFPKDGKSVQEQKLRVAQPA